MGHRPRAKAARRGPAGDSFSCWQGPDRGRPASCGLRGACSRPRTSCPNRSASVPPARRPAPPNSHGGARPPRKVSFGGVKGERRVSPSMAGSCGPRGISPPRSGAVSRARLRCTDLLVPASAPHRMPGPATPPAGGRGLATASTALPSCQRWWCGGPSPRQFQLLIEPCPTHGGRVEGGERETLPRRKGEAISLRFSVCTL